MKKQKFCVLITFNLEKPKKKSLESPSKIFLKIIPVYHLSIKPKSHIKT